ncbi:LysR family transcriptional regulator [Luteibacter aegosomatis]|uniref:LysR family transcriptional regulator n=1 Tax=Luteibacter aegosomatis TaxID=2911537 RepID=UPI001FF70D03|nr:LysR family transcriptional regulator [Luteibacter aegosomatis]UPG85635.1 LysR family transcriptional regulator [Luteibacter aegosomatis]
MKGIRPADLVTFLAVARHLSFSRAATELGVSPSALSHTIRGIEGRLGVRLLNRTTRSVSLTEAGERLVSRIEPAFRDIDDALDDLNASQGRVVGKLRIGIGLVAARVALLPVVAGFLARYPEVEIEVVTDDALVDVVAEGLDLGVRFGERIAGDMIAVPLVPRMRSLVVVSPGCLARHRVPRTPHDLQGLPCIRQRFPSGAMYHWEFERGGIALETEVDGPLILRDMTLCSQAALDGLGFAFVFEKLIEDDLAAGRLVGLLEDWCPYHPGMFVYYPGRRQPPTVLKAFVDYVREHPQ